MKRLLLLLLLLSGLAHGQDILYLQNGVKQPGKVTEIGPEVIQYKADGVMGQVPRSQVLAVFNNYGDYLTISPTIPAASITAFLNPPPEKRSADIIITNKGIVAYGTITGETMDLIYWVSRGIANPPADKKQIVAIIRQDGRHEVLGNIAVQTDVLEAARVQIPEKLAEAKEVKETMLASGMTEGDALVEDETKLPFDSKLMERKGLDKVEQLHRYMKLIANKNTAMHESAQGIESAVGLFASEDATVEVFSPATGIKNRRKIRQYLVNLRQLKYDQVEIKWKSICYVSKLRLGPDGKYYGTVGFVQEFKALSEGKTLFVDRQNKKIEIVIGKYTKLIDGKEEEQWDVFLSDIGVSQTRA